MTVVSRNLNDTTNLTSSTYVPFYYSWIVAYSIADIVKFTNPPLTTIDPPSTEDYDYHYRNFVPNGWPFKTYNFTKPNQTFFNALAEENFLCRLFHRKFKIVCYDSDSFVSEAKGKLVHGGRNNILESDLIRILVVAEEFSNKTFEEVCKVRCVK